MLTHTPDLTEVANLKVLVNGKTVNHVRLWQPKLYNFLV